jgi:hypothetical protein
MSDRCSGKTSSAARFAAVQRVEKQTANNNEAHSLSSFRGLECHQRTGRIHDCRVDAAGVRLPVEDCTDKALRARGHSATSTLEDCMACSTSMPFFPELLHARMRTIKTFDSATIAATLCYDYCLDGLHHGPSIEDMCTTLLTFH